MSGSSVQSRTVDLADDVTLVLITSPLVEPEPREPEPRVEVKLFLLAPSDGAMDEGAGGGTSK